MDRTAIRRLIPIAWIACAAAGASLSGAVALAEDVVAEDVVPEDDPLWNLPGPGPLGLGLGWDRGPVYGLDAPLRVRGRIGLTLDLDGGWVDGTPDDDGFQGAVRRARFGTQGRFEAWYGPAYKFQFDVEGTQVLVNDLYLRWELRKRFASHLKVGYFKQPTSLSALASSASRPMMELAAPVSAFQPGRRLGVQIDGVVSSPDLTWQTSLSSVGQSRQDADESDSILRGIARLVWRPWYQEEDGVPTLLHLGMSAGYTFSGRGDLRYRARPESFLVDFLLDTGSTAGNAVLLAWEAAWQRGPTTVQAELLLSLADADRGSARLGGLTVEASRVLTGESRPYHRSDAVFDRIRPRQPLSWQRRQWGAFQLTGRLSWIDLDDGPVRGGRMLVTNVELVWTWNRYVRVHAGCVYAHAKQRSTTANAVILQSRLELRF